MARLGVRPAGTASAADLHTPGFDPDEAAVALGTTILTAAALLD
jgi:amidohydrolase